VPLPYRDQRYHLCSPLPTKPKWPDDRAGVGRRPEIACIALGQLFRIIQLWKADEKGLICKPSGGPVALAGPLNRRRKSQGEANVSVQWRECAREAV
jgi:hypothetical protein